MDKFLSDSDPISHDGGDTHKGQNIRSDFRGYVIPQLLNSLCASRENESFYPHEPIVSRRLIVSRLRRGDSSIGASRAPPALHIRIKNSPSPPSPALTYLRPINL